MDYVDYLWIKAGAILVIVFVVNLLYSAITGRSIEQDRRDE